MARAGSWNLNSGDECFPYVTAALLAASRRKDEQATAPASPPGVQGQGGLGCRKGEKTLAELAQQYDVHPNLISQWRARLLEGAADVFVAEPAATEPAIDEAPEEALTRYGKPAMLRPAVVGLRLNSDRARNDVTPAFHSVATRDRPVLSRRSAGEATGGVNPARCCSSSAANAAGVA